MTINGNTKLRIISKGSDEAGLGQDGYYVQRVRINGKEWRKNWINHEDVMIHGGTIEFSVSSKPVVWETGKVPPSPGHVKL
ncbi:hypothetical protein Trisim1_005177 [Trichoderma cf. simile WF8]